MTTRYGVFVGQGSLKNELIHHQRYATRADAKAAIQQYIESFYNRQRRHSRLGNVPPELFAENSANGHVRLETRVSAIETTPQANDTSRFVPDGLFTHRNQQQNQTQIRQEPRFTDEYEKVGLLEVVISMSRAVWGAQEVSVAKSSRSKAKGRNALTSALTIIEAIFCMSTTQNYNSPSGHL